MSVRFLTLLVITWALLDRASSSDGLQFIVGFMSSVFFGDAEQMALYVVSHNPCGISCRVTYSSVTDEIVVPAFSSVTVNVNATLMMTTIEFWKMKGIAIDTNARVVVFGMAKQIGTSDGFMAIPVNRLGQVYLACVYFPTAFQTQMAIVGVDMNTDLVIKLADNENSTVVFFDGDVFSPGDTISVTIQRLDIIQIQSLGDLTGSRVVANKPISFFSGNYHTSIHSFGGGEPVTSLVEQLLPVEQWGTIFFLVPTPLNTFNDVIRIVVDVKPVTIQMTCLNSFDNGTFNRNFVIYSSFEELSFPAGYYCNVVSSKPVMVVKYAPNDRTDVDPTMMIVPAFKHFRSRYPFEAPLTARNTEMLEIFLMFAVKESEKAGLLLDKGSLPDNVVFNPVPGTDFVGGFVRIEPGHHTFKNTYGPFMTLLYGRDFAESYGFPLGMNLEELNTMEPQPPGPVCAFTTDVNEPTTTDPQTTTADTSTAAEAYQNVSTTQTSVSVVTDASVLPSTQGMTSQSSNIASTTSCEGCSQSTTARQQLVPTTDDTTYPSTGVASTELTTTCVTMVTCNAVNQSSHVGCLQLCQSQCRPTLDSPLDISGQRVDPKQTSRYRRSLTSATDNRLSVVICGSVGGAILCCLALGIIALDLDNLMSMFRRIKRNVCRQHLDKPREKVIVRI